MDEELHIGDFIAIAASATDQDPRYVARVVIVPSAESALAAPHAAFGGERFYADPIARAAILCSRIVRNHPLPDGNKRAAYLSMMYVLDIQGIEWRAPSEAEADQVIRSLAAREISEPDFVEWVQEHTA